MPNGREILPLSHVAQVIEAINLVQPSRCWCCGCGAASRGAPQLHRGDGLDAAAATLHAGSRVFEHLAPLVLLCLGELNELKPLDALSIWMSHRTQPSKERGRGIGKAGLCCAGTKQHPCLDGGLIMSSQERGHQIQGGDRDQGDFCHARPVHHIRQQCLTRQRRSCSRLVTCVEGSATSSNSNHVPSTQQERGTRL